MCSCLQCDATLRHPRKCLLHRFWCRRHFLFQNDFACFIQNTVERPAISQIHTDRQPLVLENFALECLLTANLLHSQPPFLLPSARPSSGAYRIPPNTRVLTPSDLSSTTSPYHLRQSPPAAF